MVFDLKKMRRWKEIDIIFFGFSGEICIGAMRGMCGDFRGLGYSLVFIWGIVFRGLYLRFYV